MFSKNACLVLSGSVVLALAGSARAQFVEQDVVVLASFTAENPGDSFGFVAEVIGDIDDDDVPDYVIGAPNYGPAGSLRGRAYVYSGSTGDLLHVHTGEVDDRLGWGVASAGDANDDGIPDYVVSGPGVFGVGHMGRALVISGLDHTVLHDVNGDPDSFFGYDVNTAGDVDQDGYDDVIVGALLGGPGLSGRVYVISGMDGSILWERDGSAAGVRFGSAVSAVGDLDGDGSPEQAVGAFADGNAGTGLTHVLSGADGSIVFTLVPDTSAGTFGWFFAHAAGDVDRDRVPDIYVGDFGDSGFSGRSYVFSGATGAVIWAFGAENAGDGLGMGRGAGDVDRDKCDDLLLGAYTSSDGAPSGGKVYLASGQDASVMRTFTGTEKGALLGFDVVALGDVDSDRYPDYLITGSDVAYVVAGVNERRVPPRNTKCRRRHDPRPWPPTP